MLKLLKMFIILVTLGFITPFIFSATTDMKDAELMADLEEEDIRDLEEELKRLLESEESEELISPEVELVSEKQETLEISKPAASDEEQKLVIEYDEPITKEEIEEFNAAPGEEEVIILNNAGEEKDLE